MRSRHKPHETRPTSMSATGSRAVDLRIHELGLHGFAPAEGHRIAGAVEGELTRLLSREGIPDSFTRRGETETLDAGAFALPSTASAGQIGRHVARALYRRLSR